jgi:hypothetical protein
VALSVKFLTWNNVLRLVGLLGLAHETLVNNVDRPTLLVVFATMIGLPSFWQNQQREEK